MIVMGAGTNHWFHSDQTYRAMLAPGPVLRLPGRQRRRLGPLRRAGEGAADHRLVDGRLRARLVAAAAPAAGDAVLVPGDRPVALRDASAPSEFTSPAGNGALGERHTRRLPRARRPARLAALLPDLRPQPARPRRRGRGERAWSRPTTSSRELRGRAGSRFACRGPRRPGELPARADALAGEPARLLEQGPRVLPRATCSASPTRPCDRDESAPEQRPDEVEWRDEAPIGQARPVHDARLPDERLVHSTPTSSCPPPPGTRSTTSRAPTCTRSSTRSTRRSRRRGRRDRLGRLQPDRRPSSARLADEAPRHAHRPRRRAAPARHARRARAAVRRGPRLAGGRVRADPRARRCRSWSPSSATTRAVAEKMTRARPARREARDRRQGRRAGSPSPRSRSCAPQRRATAAAPPTGARRCRDVDVCETILALSGTTNGRLAVESFRALEQQTGARARRPPRGARRRADHVRRDRDPAAQGDRLGRVVGARVARAPLLAVHRQRRAADPVADADRPPAVLRRPRVDARPRRGPARLPAAGRRRPARRRSPASPTPRTASRSPSAT